MSAQNAEGWHYGPAGEQEPGYIEGTSFQPGDVQDHMDAWGSPHPGDLAECGDCRAAATLTGGAS